MYPLDFTSWEHWAPFNFYQSVALFWKMYQRTPQLHHVIHVDVINIMHVHIAWFQIVSFTVYLKKIPARVSDFFPTIDLVPTNLFLVLFLAETLVKPPSFFSFSSTVSSAILFMKTADHFRPVMLCSPLCKGYETSTEVKSFIQRRQ